jgi:hypothetical protein
MNNSERTGRENAFFVSVLALATFIGLFLRCYLLPGQILLDDEWHGLFYVIGKSPFYLFTHFSVPGATCIPLNLYTWALGATVGWSELLLRLPCLVCGILCIIVCPWLARDIIGTRRAVWLALLLAVSPQLIFYSRNCRPYSVVAFLGFVSLLFAARWAQYGGRRLAVLFVVTGILAIYFHLFAVVAVVAPVLVAIVYHLSARLFSKRETLLVKPSLQHWIIVSVIIAAFSGLLLLPALIHSWGGTFSKIALLGSFKFQSVARAMTLIAGTAQPSPLTLFWALVVAGAIEQCRRNPWFGGMLVSLYPLYLLALALSRPGFVESPIVLVRYCIPLVPVTLLFAACGIEAVLQAFAKRTGFQPILQTLTAFGCAAALVLAGPLPQIYSTPNNFTNHGAYQQRYSPIDWSHSFYSDLVSSDMSQATAVPADEVSPFYKKLGDHPDGRPIVEYPMMIGDHCNPLYYYQYFHRRPVLVGYTTDVNALGSLTSGNVYGNNYIDHVLSLVQDPSHLRFRNLVSMDDLSAMRARSVEYIILHKRFEAQLYRVAPPLPDLPRLYEEYREQIGPPAYEDDHIAVFQLSQ